MVVDAGTQQLRHASDTPPIRHLRQVEKGGMVSRRLDDEAHWKNTRDMGKAERSGGAGTLTMLRLGGPASRMVACRPQRSDPLQVFLMRACLYGRGACADLS